MLPLNDYTVERFKNRKVSLEITTQRQLVSRLTLELCKHPLNAALVSIFHVSGTALSHYAKIGFHERVMEREMERYGFK